MNYDIVEKIVVKDEAVVVSSAPSDLRPLVFAARTDPALTELYLIEGLRSMLTAVARSIHRGEMRPRARSAITRCLRASLHTMTLDVFLAMEEDEAARQLAAMTEEILLGCGEEEETSDDHVVRVRLFGAVEMENRWGKFEENRARASHPVMLLKYLLANPGRTVDQSELLATVWPSSEVQENTSRVRLRRLREALAPMRLNASKTGLIYFSDFYYGINPEYTLQIDATEFIGLAHQIKDYQLQDPVGLKLCRDALELYRGPYMAFTKDAPWLDKLRDYYRQEFVYVATETLKRSKELGSADVIPLLSRRSAAVVPENEALQREIIGCLMEHKLELELVRHVSQLTASGKAGWLEG